MNGDPEHPQTPAASTDRQALVYQVTAQHWAHAEQIRWTLLYNYLMASTILLLAWSTVFASSSNSSRPVLVTLALAGVILSSVWVALGSRATGFVKMYEATGLTAESAVQATDGPFASARAHRLSLKGIGRLAPSGFVLRLVPSMFVVLYAVLVSVSLCQK